MILSNSSTISAEQGKTIDRTQQSAPANDNCCLKHLENTKLNYTDDTQLQHVGVIRKIKKETERKHTVQNPSRLTWRPWAKRNKRHSTEYQNTAHR